MGICITQCPSCEGGISIAIYGVGFTKQIERVQGLEELMPSSV